MHRIESDAQEQAVPEAGIQIKLALQHSPFCRLSHKLFVFASFSGSVRSTLENILVPFQKTMQNTPQAPRKSEFSALPMGCQCVYVSVCGGLYGSVWG